MRITEVSSAKVSRMCVYMIRNTVNGKMYIGQTCNLARRISLHISRSRNRFKEARRRQLLENNSKFDEEQKRKIYEEYIAMKKKSQRQIAKRFGCSQNTVARIVREKACLA